MRPLDTSISATSRPRRPRTAYRNSLRGLTHEALRARLASLAPANNNTGTPGYQADVLRNRLNLTTRSGALRPRAERREVRGRQLTPGQPGRGRFTPTSPVPLPAGAAPTRTPYYGPGGGTPGTDYGPTLDVDPSGAYGTIAPWMVEPSSTSAETRAMYESYGIDSYTGNPLAAPAPPPGAPARPEVRSTPRRGNQPRNQPRRGSVNSYQNRGRPGNRNGRGRSRP